MADSQTQPSTSLAERYGRTNGRRTPIIATATALTLLLAVVGWMAFQASNDSVRASLYAWEEPAHGVLATTVEIRRDAGTAVTCDLIAVDARHVTVGQVTLDVPAGSDEHIRVDADIPLEGDGLAPELRGCEATE